MTPPTVHPRSDIIRSAVLSCLIILIAGGMALVVLSDRDLKEAFILPRVAAEIDHAYPEPVDWEKAASAGRESMYDMLDRFSFYVEPRQLRQLDEEMSGGYGGIGVSVIRHDLGLLVMSVRENGPAAAAGVLTGDLIFSADTVMLAGIDQDKASSLLRGVDGSRVKLGLLRNDHLDTLHIEVTRKRIQFQHVPYAGFTPDTVMYVRLADFDAGAAKELEHALDSLLAIAGMTPHGLILDLRGNPGGLFWEAYHTANLFLNKGQFIVGTEARSRWQEEKHFATGPDHLKGLPMTVLVDRGSASSSEIVAGALRQLGRASLVGDTTFGKGLVQGYTRFPDGSGSRLTISRYFLEGGLFLNRFDSTLSDTGNGLVPDHVIPLPENEPYLRNLESSLLLQRFASAFQDLIIGDSTPFMHTYAWLDSLKRMAETDQFSARTPLVLSAEQLVSVARSDKSSPALSRVADRIAALARFDELNQLDTHQDYIRMRVRKLAYERKFGLTRSYTDVIVRERPDIRFAASLVRGKS
ncbi:MAG: S41 family peptidase [Candidatus Zixiibacteriota bacterium]